MSEEQRPKVVAKKRQLAIHVRTTEVEAKKFRDLQISNVEIRMEFDEVLATGKYLEVWFTYAATYMPEVGYIKMKGIMMVEMGEKAAERNASTWNQSRQIDQSTAAGLLNHINYRCGSEAMFVCKLLELPSPLVPPPVSVIASEEQGGAHAEKPATPQKPAAGAPAANTQPAGAAPRAGGVPPRGQQPGQVPYNYISPFTGKKPS